MPACASHDTAAHKAAAAWAAAGPSGSYAADDVTPPRLLTDADFAFLREWRGEGVARLCELRAHALARRARALPPPPPIFLTPPSPPQAIWADVRRRAYEYRCVATLAFLAPSARRHPRYGDLLNAAAPGGLLLDVGCAFGTDTRALILDGSACRFAAAAGTRAPPRKLRAPLSLPPSVRLTRRRSQSPLSAAWRATALLRTGRPGARSSATTAGRPPTATACSACAAPSATGRPQRRALCAGRSTPPRRPVA